MRQARWLASLGDGNKVRKRGVLVVVPEIVADGSGQPRPGSTGDTRGSGGDGGQSTETCGRKVVTKN